MFAAEAEPGATALSAHRVRGACHCGAVSVALTLTRAPENYPERACDCDFCRQHGAAFVSDPAGALRIAVRAAEALRRYRQGSGVAECLLCACCGVFVGVVCVIDARLYGTVNTRVLDPSVGFGATVCVSPKQLSVEEKQQRWRANWFDDVRLDVGADAAGERWRTCLS